MSNEVINVVQSAKPWSPLDLGNALHFFLSTSNTLSMMKEDGISGVPISNTSIDEDDAGFLYEQSNNSLTLSAEGARKAKLSSDGIRNSFLRFDAFDENFIIENSKKFFGPMLKASPFWKIAFYIKMGSGSDGIFYYIADAVKGTSVNNGISIQRNSSNKLRIQLAVGVGNKINYTSTKSLTEANGWVKVEISVNGAGSNVGTMDIDGTIETFSTTAGINNSDFTYDLTIASGANGVGANSPLNGSLSDFIIVDYDADLTEYATYNPSRVISRFSTLSLDFDYNDNNNIWQDEARTSVIAANQPIALLDSKKITTFGSLNNYISTSVSAERPIFKTSQINGLSVGDWDGVDDNLALNKETERGGKWVMFFVVKNTDSANGSHIASGGLYVTVTGASYSGNSPNPYFVVHPSDGSNLSPIDLKNPSDGWNILALRRDGSNWALWNGSKAKSTATNAVRFQISDFGLEKIAGWQMVGQQARFIMYNGVMTDAQVDSKIDELNSIYNI